MRIWKAALSPAVLVVLCLVARIPQAFAQDGYIGEKWLTKVSEPIDSQQAKAGKSDPAAANKVVTKANDADKRCQRKWGRQFRSLGVGDVCVRYEGSVFGFLGKEFTDKDVVMEGRRLWSGSSGSPLVTARLKDVSDETDDIDVGGGLLNDISLVRDTPWGPALGFIQVGLFSEGDLGSINTIFDSQNIYNDRDELTLYPGIFEQAWLRLRGLTVGIQPSQFDFMRPGYAPFPGYATRDTTAALAYNYRQKDWSLAVAVEDGRRRDMDDGILARYDRNAEIRPDFVTQFRARQKGIVYHASLAVHDIDDETLDDFGIQSDEDFGLAGRLGIEFKWSWMRDRKNPLDDEQVRLMFSIAAAEGAIGYLGVPMFATDYVTENDGGLSLSSGISGIASVEKAWATGVSVSATLSAYALQMQSHGSIGPDSMPFHMSTDVDVYGAKLQIGAQKVIDAKTKIGAEVAYTWTRAESALNGFDLNPVEVSYPEVRGYIARRF